MKKAEAEHLSKVAALGCIACKNQGFPDTPAEIHHIRTGQGRKRATHYEVIGLCPAHHRTGGFGIAIHAGPATWQEAYGSEIELLAQVRRELGIEVAA